MGGIGSGKPHFYRKKTPEQKAAIQQRIIDLMGNGSIVETVAKNLGCSRRSFFEAVNEFPELNEAYQQGKNDFVSWFDSVFKASMLGLKVIDENTNQEIKINPTMAIFYAKVHCGWREAEKHTIEVSGGVSLDYKNLSRLEKNLEIFKKDETSRIPEGKPNPL